MIPLQFSAPAALLIYDTVPSLHIDPFPQYRGGLDGIPVSNVGPEIHVAAPNTDLISLRDEYTCSTG